MKRSSNRYGQTQISWQAAFVLTGFIFLGITIAAWVLSSNNSDPRQRDADSFDNAVLIYFVDPIVLALAALGMWSRLRSFTPDKRSRIALQIGKGVCIILSAIIVTLVSRKCFNFEMLGEYWYILPTGLYLWGMADIANAMNPRLDGSD
jgi:hypothetical protein